jgi:hypothetical protein
MQDAGLTGASKAAEHVVGLLTDLGPDHRSKGKFGTAAFAGLLD